MSFSKLSPGHRSGARDAGGHRPRAVHPRAAALVARVEGPRLRPRCREVPANGGRRDQGPGRRAGAPRQRAGRHPRGSGDGAARDPRLPGLRRRAREPVRARDEHPDPSLPLEGHEHDVRGAGWADGPEPGAAAPRQGLQGRRLVGQRLPSHLQQQAPGPHGRGPARAEAAHTAHQGSRGLLPRPRRGAHSDGLGRGVPGPAAGRRRRSGDPRAWSASRSWRRCRSTTRSLDT